MTFTLMIKKNLILLYPILVRISWLWNFKTRDNRKGDYSICIVTYCKRFDKNFKPLIKKLKVLFPNTEIIVGVNGYYDQEVQRNYLGRFIKFISKYHNIKWFNFDTGQSLSKMWNQCILRSSNQWMLILNDDLLLSKKFREVIDHIELQKDTIYILNSSWSHFFISKEIISSVGWFDERFPGVGNEDWDYEVRALLKGKKIEIVKTWAIINLVVLTKDFSYSAKEVVVNQKYSNSNWEFFNKKWSVLGKSEEGYLPTRILQIPYIKLKEGMETPNFYDNDKQ